MTLYMLRKVNKYNSSDIENWSNGDWIEDIYLSDHLLLMEDAQQNQRIKKVIKRYFIEHHQEPDFYFLDISSGTRSELENDGYEFCVGSCLLYWDGVDIVLITKDLNL